MARLALWEVGEHRKDDDDDRKSIKVKDDVSGSAACWRVLEQEAGVRPFLPPLSFSFHAHTGNSTVVEEHIHVWSYRVSFGRLGHGHGRRGGSEEEKGEA